MVKTVGHAWRSLLDKMMSTTPANGGGWLTYKVFANGQKKKEKRFSGE
jgi:hypothetical protein